MASAGKIDAHVHLSAWWPEVRRTGYRPDLDYTVDGLLAEMDRHGITHAVAIQIFQAPSLGEALDEGRRWFEKSKGRLLPVATVDPTQGEDRVSAALERLENVHDGPPCPARAWRARNLCHRSGRRSRVARSASAWRQRRISSW